MDRTTFGARYESQCRTCGRTIEVGQQIYVARDEGYGKKRYFHGECDNNAEPATHRHVGRWPIHPVVARHREDYAPEMHGGQGSRPEVQPQPQAVNSDADFSEQLRDAMGTMKDAFDSQLEGMREQIADQQDALDSMDSTKDIVVHTDSEDNEGRNVGTQHVTFPALVKYASIKRSGRRQNVAMKGPAGSGKTTAAAALAKALDLQFYSVSLSAQTPESKLVGYMNAAGDYVKTLIREAFEFGGVILFDEMDACGANVLTVVNAILATRIGDEIGFADGMVARHEDCVFVCAMNTYGRGADAEYVGRAKLDAATIDRFIFLDWEYDWALTRAFADNDEWTNYVEQISEAVIASKVRIIVGPRKAFSGADMLASGIDREEVEERVIWGSIGTDDAQKIKAALTSPSGRYT